tara:strand:- start:4 stop:489 length:486 start_codon:yes stop_codon:yes gene_type:complete
MKEVWKSIEGYEGLYEVSNLGRVKSVFYSKSKDKILKSNVDSTGYLCLNLCKNKKQIKVHIHRLLAINFLNHTPCGMKLVVDHINNIKTDNRLENLQIITHRENSSKDRVGMYSKLTGVRWYKNSNKWASVIGVSGKKKHLGMFNTELEASNAYQLALKGL